MATSGIRIGELIQLEIKHVDLNNRRILIPAYIAKTREQRTVYITTECAEAINVWLKHRPQYMDQVKKQAVAFKPTYGIADTRLFPLTDSSLRNAIDTAVNNAGLLIIDETTRRSTILPHSFRKWFSTIASLHMTDAPVQKIMGHEIAYSGAYVKLTDQDIEAVYRKNERCLFIGSDEEIRSTLENVSGDMMKINEENAMLKKDVASLKKIVAELVIKGLVLESDHVEGEDNITIKH